MPVRPLRDIVAIRQKDPAEYVGSIYIPSDARKKPLLGEVVAAGPGEIKGGKLVPCQAKVGDMVLYESHWMGEYQDVDNETLVFIHDDEILAIDESGSIQNCELA